MSSSTPPTFPANQTNSSAPEMDITVYVPCYNGEEFVEGCIQSLLKQTLPPRRILFIDDGSSDDSARQAAEFPIEVISHKANKGLAAARNTALNECTSPYLASLDVDCLADSEWLTNLARFFEKASGKIAGVGGKLIEGHQAELGDKWRATHMPQHWGDHPADDVAWLYGNNNLYDVAALREVGGFKPIFRTNYEDVDISNRLRQAGWRLVYTPAATVTHRRHDSFASAIYTRWRWTAITADRAPTMGLFLKHFVLDWARGVYFTGRDFLDLNLDLLPADFAYPWLASYYEIRHLLRGRS